MTDEMIDFNNILVLRNQLIAVPIEELCKLYQDKDRYISFLENFTYHNYKKQKD